MDKSAESSSESIPEEKLIAEARTLLSRTKSALEEHGLWMRKRCGVDLIIGAHLRRATLALESTIQLAESANGYDAAVTARVVLEHALSAAAIALADDPEREAYFFIIRQWRHVQDADRKLRGYYPDLDPPDREAEAEVGRLIAQTENSWAGERLSKTVDLLDEKLGSGQRLFRWFFDIPYSALSHYAHPRALGLRTLVPTPGEPFRFHLTAEPSLAVNSVRQAMMAYLALMIAVQQAWGDQALREIVLDPLRKFVQVAGPAGVVDVFEV